MNLQERTSISDTRGPFWREELEAGILGGCAGKIKVETRGS
jgi:hypothetical protein